MKHPIRKHTPKREKRTGNYKNYTKYKTSLASDFYDSCGYCGIHHMFFGHRDGFHIDHFAPKSKFPALECDYNNLIYSCPICNKAKSDDWCSSDAKVCYLNGKGFINPRDSTYDDIFYRDTYGRICVSENHPNYSVGIYMHKRLKFSLKRHEVFWLFEYLNEILNKLKQHFDRMDDASLPIFWEIKKIISKLEIFRNKYYDALKVLDK